MKELLERFNYNLTRIKKLPETRELIVAGIKRKEKELEELNHKINLIQDSRIAYQKTIDAFYEESIGQLEKLINCALRTIFTDRQYQIKISLSQSPIYLLNFQKINHSHLNLLISLLESQKI